ncbi:MAG: FdtA/QdtA family cupin domain-containing protein [Lachnospiraceae bacterium]|nr:FdtA/QdtA family cupin domain-containing protein [Lachnospiraceae bacterium]MBP5415420.1 FdtA/QdtA family cupin domain-containing protein [Lachnospiraceae bacterium]
MRNIEEMYKIIEFDELGDERGNLVVAEGESDLVPFLINRIFYIYGSDSQVVRGQHANKKTKFILINVSGTSKVKLDNGKETRIIELNKPKMGLFIDTMLWKDMYDFSPDSVLLVLASEHYDSEEYIRDYDNYIELLKSEEV